MRTLLLLGLVLSLDSFRVSLALGALKLSPRRQAQIVLAFGLCDGVAPLVGLLAGQFIVTHVGRWVEYLGPVLLCVYGVSVIYASCGHEEKEAPEATPWMVLGLPLSMSLDNLVAGTSLGMTGFPVIISAALIGTMSALLSLAGLLLGRAAVKHFGLKTELLAGAALILIALFMAFENR